MSGSGRCSYSAGTQAASRLFFSLDGRLLLHNVQSVTFRSPMETPTALFTASNSWVCPRISYNVSLLPRRSCYLLLHPLMLPAVLPGPLRLRPLRSAGTARRVNRPLTAASFCRDTPLLWLRFFGGPRRLKAWRRYLHMSSVALIVSSRVLRERRYCAWHCGLHFFQVNLNFVSPLPWQVLIMDSVLSG
jgi:hypothetical protein